MRGTTVTSEKNKEFTFLHTIHYYTTTHSTLYTLHYILYTTRSTSHMRQGAHHKVNHIRAIHHRADHVNTGNAQNG